MDNKILCRAFLPPPPQSMDAYLDDVTRNHVGTIRLGDITALDRAIDLIIRRPSATERAALLATLEERIEQFGRENGWLESVPIKEEAKRIDEITNFVVTEVFGLKGASVREKAVDAFTGELKTFVKENLNARGKRSLVLLDFVYSLCTAKSPEEARNAILKLAGSSLAKWAASPGQWQALLKAGLRTGGVRPVVINRFTKLVATRLTWAEVKLSRLGWITPWFLFFDIFLSPESTATDDYERRCTFLVMYARVHTRRSDQFESLITACAGEDWRYKIAPADALTRVLKQLQ